MFNRKLFRILTSFALVLTLVMVLAPVNAFAEIIGEFTHPVSGFTAPTKEQRQDLKNDLTTDEKSKAVATVYGLMAEGIVYSVDVEWGTMTFLYETSGWDPETLKKTSDAGWKVYDWERKVALTETQHETNRITVTNHSNADVTATMSYSATNSSNINDVTFSGSNNASTEDIHATYAAESKKLSLESAAKYPDSEDATKGTATVGNVYFMPNTAPQENTLAEWKEIGQITITIAQPPKE